MLVKLVPSATLWPHRDARDQTHHQLSVSSSARPSLSTSRSVDLPVCPLLVHSTPPGQVSQTLSECLRLWRSYVGSKPQGQVLLDAGAEPCYRGGRLWG